MKTVGEFVQETADFMNSGAYRQAVLPCVLAIEATARKVFDKNSLSEEDYKRFL